MPNSGGGRTHDEEPLPVRLTPAELEVAPDQTGTDLDVGSGMATSPGQRDFRRPVVQVRTGGRPRPLDSSERFVVFVDAVVAIALTLLVLPLVELVPEASRDGSSLPELLGDHLREFGAFALSFVVIFRFWWAHHRLFRHVSRLNRRLLGWSVLWMFSIVFLPVPTAIITAYAPSYASVALYIGTLTVTSTALTSAALTVRRHPELSDGRSPESREELLGNVTILGAQVLALIVGTAFPDTVNYFALLLMLLTDPVEYLVKRRWSAASAC